MARLRLTAAARADLVQIRTYSLQEFGPEVADVYFRGFNQAFTLLRERPYAGVARPELGESVRCLTQRRHRLFYRLEDDLVLIIRILHHARNAQWELSGISK